MSPSVSPATTSATPVAISSTRKMRRALRNLPVGRQVSPLERAADKPTKRRESAPRAGQLVERRGLEARGIRDEHECAKLQARRSPFKFFLQRCIFFNKICKLRFIHHAHMDFFDFSVGSNKQTHGNALNAVFECD